MCVILRSVKRVTLDACGFFSLTFRLFKKLLTGWLVSERYFHSFSQAWIGGVVCFCVCSAPCLMTNTACCEAQMSFYYYYKLVVFSGVFYVCDCWCFTRAHTHYRVLSKLNTTIDRLGSAENGFVGSTRIKRCDQFSSIFLFPL